MNSRQRNCVDKKKLFSFPPSVSAHYLQNLSLGADLQISLEISQLFQIPNKSESSNLNQD